MKRSASDNSIVLREVVEGDLPIFFEHQRDPKANRMAAFPAREKEPFMKHWAGILANNDVLKRTILFRDQVAGNIVCFEHAGRRLIGYWLGREFWSQGIATGALTKFVAEVKTRPLHAHVFKENRGSIRVLEKCGFTLLQDGVTTAEDGVEEFVYVLAE